MAVTSCTMVREGDLETVYTRDRARTYDLTFNIKTNSNMGPISVSVGALSASPNPLPDIWDSFTALGDSDLDCYCDRVQLKRIDPKLWKAYAHFSTLQPGQNPDDANTNPLLRPVRYRGAKMVVTKPVTRDRNGVPITNSAKEEFDEPLEAEIIYPLLVATRNVATLDQWLSDLATFGHTVNSSQYRLQAARKWWCSDIDISDVIYEQGVAYYQETWQLGWNPDTWDEFLLDRGWKVLNTETPPKKVNATDDKGKAVSEPVLLDGTGKKLATGGQPVALQFRCKREVAWTNMPV